MSFTKARRWCCVFTSLCLLLADKGLLAQGSLDAKDWQSRATALTKLETTLAPKDSALQAKLITVLKMENERINSSLHRSNSKEGVSAELGEGYSEYYSKLYTIVLNIAKSGNDAALPILADGAFNSDSQAALFLAERWTVTLPIFLQKSQSGPVERAQSLGMMGRIASLAAQKHSTQSQLNSIKDALRLGLADKDVRVRIAAVRSTSEAGFAELLPTIETLARHDGAHYQTAGKVHYPVREEATKAAQQLNEE